MPTPAATAAIPLTTEPITMPNHSGRRGNRFTPAGGRGRSPAPGTASAGRPGRVPAGLLAVGSRAVSLASSRRSNSAPIRSLSSAALASASPPVVAGMVHHELDDVDHEQQDPRPGQRLEYGPGGIGKGVPTACLLVDGVGYGDALSYGRGTGDGRADHDADPQRPPRRPGHAAPAAGRRDGAWRRSSLAP